MIIKFGKSALLLLGICALSAAPVFADSTTTFTFTGTLGNIGPTDTFTSGSLSLVATGYSSRDTTTDMWAKALGPTETGLGVAAGTDHEISGSMFVQLNLSHILAASPSGVSISINSIQGADAYDVWGSNTAGSLGTRLASNQKGLSLPLADLGSFIYISITSPMGTVLIDDVDVTTAGTTAGTALINTPEPSSASLLLIGLVVLVGAGTLGKKLIT